VRILRTGVDTINTGVDRIKKYYVSHIQTSLDAAAIDVMRPKKRKP